MENFTRKFPGENQPRGKSSCDQLSFPRVIFIARFISGGPYFARVTPVTTLTSPTEDGRRSRYRFSRGTRRNRTRECRQPRARVPRVKPVLCTRAKRNCSFTRPPHRRTAAEMHSLPANLRAFPRLSPLLFHAGSKKERLVTRRRETDRRRRHPRVGPRTRPRIDSINRRRGETESTRVINRTVNYREEIHQNNEPVNSGRRQTDAIVENGRMLVNYRHGESPFIRRAPRRVERKRCNRRTHGFATNAIPSRSG